MRSFRSKGKMGNTVSAVTKQIQCEVKQSVLFFGENPLLGSGLLPVIVFLSSRLLRARIRLRSHPYMFFSAVQPGLCSFYRFPADLLCLIVRSPLAAVLGSVFFPNVASLT